MGGGWNEPLCMDSQKHTGPGLRAEALTIPELEQSKAAVLNTLASVHSRRSYTFAINSFTAWYVIGDSVLYRSLSQTVKKRARSVTFKINGLKTCHFAIAKSCEIQRRRCPAFP